MDIEKAAKAVRMIHPKVVFPMHQSNKDSEIFKREVSLKSDSKKVILLEVGEKTRE